MLLSSSGRIRTKGQKISIAFQDFGTLSSPAFPKIASMSEFSPVLPSSESGPHVEAHYASAADVDSSPCPRRVASSSSFQPPQALSFQQHLPFQRQKSTSKPAQPVVRLHLFHTKSLNTASGLQLHRRQSLFGEPGGGRKDCGLKRKKGANDCVEYAVFVRGGNAAFLLITTLPQMARQTLRGIS